MSNKSENKSTVRTVGFRLWTFAGILLAILLITSGVETWNMTKIERETELLGRTYLPAVKAMGQIDMMHDGIRASIFRALYESTEGKESELKAIAAEYEEFSKNIVTYSEELNTLALSREAKTAIAESQDSLSTYVEAGAKIVGLVADRKMSEAKSLIPQFQESFEALEAKLGKLGDLVGSEAEKRVEYSEKLANQADKINYTVICLGVLLALFNSFYIIRSLTKELASVTTNLSEQSKNMSAAAEQINRASLNLSESTTEQSSAIEETVTSMEEITSMIGQTSQNANHTQLESLKALENAKSGKNVVRRMVDSMNEISLTNDKLQTIVSVIDEIKSKTKVINDIAFETKLLSFNASIEAARAGAHGRGFAVVAEEVGKLAAVSNKAADDVRELLESSLSQVTSIVSETKSKVTSGQERSKECENAFLIMESSLENIGRSVELISTATREQEAGVKQTNQAMTEMEKVTQTNSGSADSLASHAGQLTEVATSVDQTVDRLRALINGSNEVSAYQADTRPKDPQERKKMKLSNSRASARKLVASRTKIEASEPRSGFESDVDKVDRNDNRWNAAS